MTVTKLSNIYCLDNLAQTAYSQQMSSDWLGLIIGNTRLHWAWFQGQKLQTAWDTRHLQRPLAKLSPASLPPELADYQTNLPLYLASVVPTQTALWQPYPNLQILELDSIPLQGLYPNMGIDRALSVWGAGLVWGFPCLVVDGGTALTFTGVDTDSRLVGGAIMPGLRTQLQSLESKTAALPSVDLPLTTPSRWATNTTEAIASGIVYTVTAGILDFIQDWHKTYPLSRVVFTGGDGYMLHKYCQQISSDSQDFVLDSKLAFWGMRSLVCQN